MPDLLRYSFEFFPPKNPAGHVQMWEAVDRLVPSSPQFVSVTFGAGGGTRETTRDIVVKMLQRGIKNVTPHLTCVGLSKVEIDDIVSDYWQIGVRSIVALRGDMPDRGVYVPHQDGYGYAQDLMAGLLQKYPMAFKVAAYPEKHPEATSLSADIEVLKRKQDLGAECAITQFFFDVDVYFRFVEMATKAGVTIPIIPGLLAMNSFNQAKSFADFCGIAVPQLIGKWFTGFDVEPANHYLAVSLLIDQCIKLYQFGVRDFHFYTLNRWQFVLAAVHALRGLHETRS